MAQKPGLIVIASEGFRRDPGGPFLPLVRDYADTLRRFRIHSTKGTALSILSTGKYTSDDPSSDHYNKRDPNVIIHRFGKEGGVVEIAGLVPQRIVEAVLFFNDPSDPYAEVPENRALQRLCKELGVRLISTLESARQWLEYEAAEALGRARRYRAHRNGELGTGYENVDPTSSKLRPLTIEQQTIALIAHDRRKEDMVLFVSYHGGFLERFDRILTTGTTGFTLKLLFADNKQGAKIIEKARQNLGKDRAQQFLLSAARLLLRHSTARRLNEVEERVISWFPTHKLPPEIEKWKSDGMPRSSETPPPVLALDPDIARHLNHQGLAQPRPELVRRIRPVRSGPKGGDIILANEVLEHRCHAAVFFQDPQSAHAHDPDIRLFERTCHFWSVREPRFRVNITCVSDPESAHRWAGAVSKVRPSQEFKLSLEERLRRREEWKLRDVVLIDSSIDPSSSDPILYALVETAGRYFLLDLRRHQKERTEIALGVGHGKTIREVVNWLEKKIDVPAGRSAGLVSEQSEWIPLVGNVSQYDIRRQATLLARELAKRLGGKPRAFISPGLVQVGDDEKLPQEDNDLSMRLKEADVILVAGGVFGPAERAAHPVGAAGEARRPVGVISSIVLDEKGAPIEDAVKTVGIGFRGLQDAAARGSVILLCAGSDRRLLVKSALTARLVSVLITDRETAEWLENQ